MSEPRVYVLQIGYIHGFMNGPKGMTMQPDIPLVHKDDYDALKAENEKLETHVSVMLALESVRNKTMRNALEEIAKFDTDAPGLAAHMNDIAKVALNEGESK